MGYPGRVLKQGGKDFFGEKYDGLGLFFLENKGDLYFFAKKYDGPGLFS